MANQTKSNQTKTQKIEQPPVVAAPAPSSEKDSTLRLIAFIFAVINTAAIGVTVGILALMMIVGIVASASGSNPAAAVAFIFLTFLFLIPLAWMIPMTVHIYKIYKGMKANTIAFGVCTLIFCNLISGILLLCSDKDN